jgi:hypothetical protein
VYWLKSFDGQAIDALALAGGHDLGGGPTESSLVRLPGYRAFDVLGADQAVAVGRTVTADVEIVESTAAAARATLDAWLAKVGRRGLLVRQADDGTQHSIYARLIEAQAKRGVGHVTWLPLSLTFELLEHPWRGTARNPQATLNVSPKDLALTNGGNAANPRPVVTITAPAGGSLTSVTVELVGQGYRWKWTGTLAAGKALVIDCGAATVKADGADAYAGFALEAAHTKEDWLTIPPGNSTLRVWYTGTANGTARIDYADGHA